MKIPASSSAEKSSRNGNSTNSPQKNSKKDTAQGNTSLDSGIGNVIVQLDQATLVNCKLMTSTGAWQIVFEVPSTQRDKIPAVSAEHQLAFTLTLSRKKRKKLREIAEVTSA